MPQPSPIARQMDTLNIPHNAAAPFIGVTINWMRDLSEYPDEAWNTLSLIQICRLVILLDVKLALLAPGDGVSHGEVIAVINGQDGALQVAGAIRQKLGDKAVGSGKSAWDKEDIKRWLSDDEEFADIPVIALNDICAIIGIDTCSVIQNYLLKLGKPGVNSAR